MILVSFGCGGDIPPASSFAILECKCLRSKPSQVVLHILKGCLGFSNEQLFVVVGLVKFPKKPSIITLHFDKYQRALHNNNSHTKTSYSLRVVRNQGVQSSVVLHNLVSSFIAVNVPVIVAFLERSCMRANPSQRESSLLKYDVVAHNRDYFVIC